MSVRSRVYTEISAQLLKLDYKFRRVIAKLQFPHNCITHTHQARFTDYKYESVAKTPGYPFIFRQIHTAIQHSGIESKVGNVLFQGATSSHIPNPTKKFLA